MFSFFFIIFFLLFFCKPLNDLAKIWPLCTSLSNWSWSLSFFFTSCFIFHPFICNWRLLIASESHIQHEHCNTVVQQNVATNVRTLLIAMKILNYWQLWRCSHLPKCVQQLMRGSKWEKQRQWPQLSCESRSPRCHGNALAKILLQFNIRNFVNFSVGNQFLDRKSVV